MKIFSSLFLFLICAMNSVLTVFAENESPPSFPVYATDVSIKIDGVIDEEAWSKAQVIPIAYEWQPGDNVPPPVKTEVMVTFDNENLYIAFRAFDSDPSKIRAHLMDRDSIDTFIQDDHVGVMIDTFNDERRAIQFRVNPFGVQADAIFSELEGIEDWSWDIIWASSGRIMERGYMVEIAIPLHQIRFPRTTTAQTWGFEAFRSWPRIVRHRMSTRMTDRNKACVLCQQNRITGIQDIRPGLNLEVDPTFTGLRTDTRSPFPNGSFKNRESDFEPGVTARWGFTPNFTLNGAVNPDFSQVEADVAQLDVNTRFALFFPEKRPFFLEGVDFFSTPINAVFTRTIVDPAWGLKLTGKEGKNGVGVFLTRDVLNNLIIPSNQASDFAQLDADVTGSVFRYRRDFGGRSTIGALYTGREGNAYHNRVFGIDGFIGLSTSDTIQYQLLRSHTDYPSSISEEHGQSSDPFSGMGITAAYTHLSRNWFLRGNYQNLDADFRADSGFLPRVDVRTVEGDFSRRIWGKTDDWFTQMNFGINYDRTEDHQGLLTDRSYRIFGNVSGPWQSFMEVAYSHVKEHFEGITYDLHRPEIFAQLKPSGDLSLEFFGQFGQGIDFTNSEKADVIFLNPSIEWKIGRPVNIQLNHTFQILDVENGRLLEANLSQLKVVYQFNLRMFVRAIVQFRSVNRDPELYRSPVDPESSELFTQFLFSYKLNPQTVLFFGYSDNHLGLQDLDLTQQDRTFFMKVGYAWLF